MTAAEIVEALNRFGIPAYEDPKNRYKSMESHVDWIYVWVTNERLGTHKWIQVKATMQSLLDARILRWNNIM